MLRTSTKIAAAVLAGGLAVTACGTMQMGAAAIVGNQRISATTLAGEVANLNSGYRRYSRQIQLQYPRSQMPQQVLSWMIRFRVRDALAARDDVTVTPANIQQALASINAQVRQSGGSLVALAVANGLPPDMIAGLGRYQALGSRLLTRLSGGSLPSGTAALQALEQRLGRSECLASRQLGIEISQQFGTLNYSQLTVVPVSSRLSATQGPSPAPSARAAC